MVVQEKHDEQRARMQEELEVQIAADHAATLKAVTGEQQQALAAVIARGEALKQVCSGIALFCCARLSLVIPLPCCCEQAQLKAHEDEVAGITARHERIISLQERDHVDRLALLHSEHAETRETAIKQHEAAVAEQLQQLTKVRR